MGRPYDGYHEIIGYDKVVPDSTIFFDDLGWVHEITPSILSDFFKELPPTDDYEKGDDEKLMLDTKPLFTQGCAVVIVVLLSFAALVYSVWA